MKQSQPLLQRLLRGDLAILFYMSLLRFLLHIAINLFAGYGLFRDELYYLACANNLAAGYVDHPPFSIYILKLTIILLGDSVAAIRLVPAFASAATVYLSGLMVIKLGGEKFAQFLACLCSFSLISLAMSGFYSMNSIDIFIWTLVGYIMILIIQKGLPKHWIILGVVLGLGLLNKIGVLFLGAGIFIGLLITPHRVWMKTKWPYLTGVLALLFFLPFIIWNVQHDLAHLEFIRNASEGKYASLSAITFIKDQFLINNPVACVVWLAGLFALLFNHQLKEYRLLAYLYIIPFIIFIVNGTSKAEYLAPAYGVLWASGSVWLERVTKRLQFFWIWRTVYCFILIFSSVILYPMVLPILPVEKYIAYADVMGFKPASNEDKELSELPQFYADMFGWKQKAQDVAQVYNSLTADDKERCAIFANNYGRCGAIDYYGKTLGLPHAIGNHNNYWIWGPRSYTGEVMIILGGSYEDHLENFEEVTLAITSDCEYCMPYEDNVNIFLCKRIKSSLSKIWPDEKHYD